MPTVVHVTPDEHIAPNLPEDVRQRLGFAPQQVELTRAFKFRLYPTRAQAAELSEWARQLKRLWNLAHEQRLLGLQRNRAWLFDKGRCPSCGVRTSYPAPEERQPVVHTAACDHVDYYRQAKEMTSLLADDVQLSRVVCSARQEVLRDLDKAWQRWRKMPGVGRPRFKRRTDSCRIYLSTPSHWSVKGRYLSLSGLAESVGEIRIEQDRPWPKDAKFSSCSIVCDVDQWYAAFPLVFIEAVKQAPHRSVGINRGVVHAIADSDGRVVDSPRFYERALGFVQKRSRKLKRKQPGSRRYHQAQQLLAKTHRKVRRQRADFIHEQSAHYVADFDLVAIEDMSVKQMTDTEGEPPEMGRAAQRDLNRGILDQGWYEFGRQLEYKAKAHGGEIRKVDPGMFSPEAQVAEEHPARGISSACSACGKPFGGPASGRAQSLCGECGKRELGDTNAAERVLVRAMSMEPPAPKTPKASIKIKGRVKRPETAPNRGEAARGGDPPVRGPDEARTFACTVEPL